MLVSAKSYQALGLHAVRVGSGGRNQLPVGIDIFPPQLDLLRKRDLLCLHAKQVNRPIRNNCILHVS